MYPFDRDRTIIRNRWYVAAFSDEVSRDPIERTLLNVPVVLYRGENDVPIAMYGICPHRYYPLARGHVEGDALVCGYHGFTFQADGKCSRIPAQNTGANFFQPTYPLHERGSLIWIWMGDRAACDPAAIPPYEDFGLDQPGWRHSSQTYFRVGGRAQLLIDNLMDLTHIAFIHQQIPVGGAFVQTKLEVEERERSLQLRRPSSSLWTGFHEMLYGPQAKFDGLSDMVSITDFYGPELIRTSGPVTQRIEGLDTVPEEIGTLWILHGITPETDRSTHYFGMMVRDFRLECAELDETMRHATSGVRAQDVEAIEAIEARVDIAAAAQRELLAKSDAPAMRVRRKIMGMLEEEVVR
jgi:phenylpropionate dioxygenase-like ring-hydroxylating dioxygenase large terminal subunit